MGTRPQGGDKCRRSPPTPEYLFSIFILCRGPVLVLIAMGLPPPPAPPPLTKMPAGAHAYRYTILGGGGHQYPVRT